MDSADLLQGQGLDSKNSVRGGTAASDKKGIGADYGMHRRCLR